jgi:hypothetical protein
MTDEPVRAWLDPPFVGDYGCLAGPNLRLDRA